MRVVLYFISAALVMALATWAYNENYRTRALLRDIDRLSSDIAADRERLSVLRAEWAWLTRPERLRDLVELNFDRLGLLPLSPEHFGRVDQIAYPIRENGVLLMAQEEGSR